MKSPQECSTTELIIQARGDNRAFLDELIRRHLSAVYSICFHYLKNREDAQDATQQTFLKVFKHLKRFNPDRDFNNWLHEIAKNTCLDMIRKQHTLPLELLETIPSTEPSPLQAAESALASAGVHQAIAGLPERYQSVLSLYYEQGFNLREIAEKLQTSVNTIKSRHRRALRLLRKALGQNQPKE